MESKIQSPESQAFDVNQREALILGNPPRIAAGYSESVIAAARTHVAKLRTTASTTTAPVAPESINVDDIPEMVLTLISCHPGLYEKVADVSVSLMAQSNLPRRDLELLVLRTDWLCQSPYNWGEHVPIAKRFGVTSEEIERITQGSTAPGWSEHDRALLKAAEELHENAMLSDPTWNTLAKTFCSKQLFELIVLVGQFTLVTYFQNSLRLRTTSSNKGLQSR